MTDVVDPREDKLPKWARDVLRELRRENRRLRGHLEANNSRYDGRVKQGGVMGGDPVFFDSKVPVRFVVGEEHDQWVDVSISDKGKVDIRAGYPFYFRPEASNVISVKIEER